VGFGLKGDNLYIWPQGGRRTFSGQSQNPLLSSTYVVECMPRCGLVYTQNKLFWSCWVLLWAKKFQQSVIFQFVFSLFLYLSFRYY